MKIPTYKHGLIVISVILVGAVMGLMLLPLLNTSQSTTDYKDTSWKPLIEVVPSTPSAGDTIRVYVKLVYLGFKEVYINPFELRTKYSINMTIIDSEGKSILSKPLGYQEADLNEKTIVVKPGDSIGIGYIETVFTRPGRYTIEARVNGPKLATDKAVAELEIKPKTVEISYENMSRVGDWILTLSVKPENPTSNDNLTLEISLKYIGNDRFKIEVPSPLIKMVTMLHVEGVDSWSIAIPSHISYIDVEPGYSQSFKFIVGPEAPFQHRFSPGVYKVEVYATVYTSDGHSISITAFLFIRIIES